MQPGFSVAPRDAFTEAKATLSSWDSCMAKDYCKSVNHILPPAPTYAT